jgi:RimJ/RimL family protein N-acetyltransferase
MNLQPTDLSNELIKLTPLQNGDFERLYLVACDPLIWEQHPNKDRYKREVFQVFFDGAIQSGGAFLVFNNKTGRLIGSSRYCAYNKDTKTISIGYTFLSRDHWGSTFNPALKRLMLDYAFRFVENVIFHIGSRNIRSQKAMEKLGAIKIGEEEMSYFGEAENLNYIYRIKKGGISFSGKN